MPFERPDLSRALREMAAEKNPNLAKRKTYVDYRADGTIERITWPSVIGKKPAKKDIDARVAAIRQRRGQGQPPDNQAGQGSQ
jgi:hypothetical protein